MAGLPRLVLVRHGHTVLSDGRVLSRRDPDLDDLGRAQARWTASRLLALGLQPDRIHSSSLLRASQSAQILAAPLGLTVQTWSQLQELDFGLLEGQFLDQQVHLARRWREEPWHFVAPEGESVAALRARLAAFLETLPRDRDQVVVGHLFCWLFALCDLLGLQPRGFPPFSLVQGGFACLEARPRGGWVLGSFENPPTELKP